MASEPPIRLALTATLPEDAARAALAGRAWLPSVEGPATIAIRDGVAVDVSRAFPTVRDLCEAPDPAAALRAAPGVPIGPLQALLDNTPPDARDPSRPWLLAPCDLQAIKAAGVTFAVSMLERVIEERARGDLQAAAAIRGEVSRLIGDDLSKLKPGSDEAMALKKVLVEQGAWSPYLEVGSGPEIITWPLLLAGAGLGAMASQLGSITVSSVSDEKSGEVGGLQKTGTQLGASIGTALAGALLISALTASFFTSISGHPDIPDRLASQTQTELAAGVPFVSDAQLETALSEARVPPATADATVQANEQARIDGLRAALSVLALMALSAIAFTGGIPTVQPGSESKPSAAPA